jgi:hypothetical protein
LALEEDMVAQKLLSKVLELQRLAEEQQEGVSKGKSGEEEQVDISEWEQVPSDTKTKTGTCFYPFASQLSEALQEADLLSSWISRNRPAFLLSDLASVPSARSDVLGSLTSKGGAGAVLKKQAKEHTGGKSLHEMVRTYSKK